MRANEAIKAIMKEQGITQERMVGLIGEKWQSGVSGALSRDMRISKFTKYANALGYEVVLHKKGVSASDMVHIDL